MGFVDNADHMANSHSVSRRTFKVDHKIVFPHSGSKSTPAGYCYPHVGAKYTQWDFRLLLVRYLRKVEGVKDCPSPRLVGIPSAGAKKALRLEDRHQTHWPANLLTNCAAICDMGLCMVLCFEEHHTKVNLWRTPTVNTVCCDKWSKVLQTFCSNQIYVTNHLHWTLYNACDSQD
jgi:hypothetical protein